MTALDCDATEASIDKIILDAGLRPHPLFTTQPQVDAPDPDHALDVAVAWAEMTRTFMLTTIASLGVLAAELAAEPVPAPNRLTALQTGFRVIGDDLININPIFGAGAPRGVEGIHYRWWKCTIVDPLTAALPAARERGLDSKPGVQGLLDTMRRLARSPIGAAVQVRVVEDIALDIATAFRFLFSRVTVDGEPLFAEADLGWIDAHIEAEVLHRAEVSDDETGMTTIVGALAEQQELLSATAEYAASWARALDDLIDAPAAGPASGR